VAEGQQGIGWTYNCAATADLVRDELASVVEGRDAMDVPAANLAMAHAVRNIGRPGVAACALSAIDIALWDLKARILEVPLHMLLGQVRETVPVYGSGGFTTYSTERLHEQLTGW